MERGSKTRLLSAAVIAAVFAAGVLIGFAADGSLGAETADSVAGESSRRSDERERRRPTYAQLDPTPEQQGLIDSIIAVHRERTTELDKATRRTYRQGFREILLETREAIKDVFTSEQAAEYQRLLDERDAREAAYRDASDGRR